MVSEKVAAFIELYGSGRAIDALKILFPSSDVCFEEFASSDDKLGTLVVNYAACMLFEGISALKSSNIALLNHLSYEEEHDYSAFINMLHFDARLIRWYENSGSIPNDEEEKFIERFFQASIQRVIFSDEEFRLFLKSYHGRSQQLFHSFAILEHNLWHLIKKKPQFVDCITGNVSVLVPKPYVSVSYKSDITPSFIEGTVPVIFMEYIDIDWRQIADYLRGKKAIFVFYDINVMYRVFADNNIREMLIAPDHFLFVLDSYWVEQFAVQNFSVKKEEKLSPVILTPQQDIRERVTDIVTLLTRSFEDTCKYPWQEDYAANQLYILGKKLAYTIKAKRVGPRRSLSCNISELIMESFEPHRVIPPLNLINDWELSQLSAAEYAKHGEYRKPRPISVGSVRRRIAHVVPIIKDMVNHAPTMRLRRLLEYYDLSRYDVYVVSSEQFVSREEEYAMPCSSSSSAVGGKGIINWMEKSGINVYIPKETKGFLSAAQDIENFLSREKIDVVLFHEVHPIHELIAFRTDVPKRVFFDHGRCMPKNPCFDYAIIAHEEEAQHLQKEYSRWNMTLKTNPKIAGIDVDNSGSGYPRSNFHRLIPPQATLLTTISNHLHSRLSMEMCICIANILRRCPETYYVLIGNWKPQERQRRIFKHYGVNHRVIHLGARKDIMPLLKTMDIYLNEFPFGGGVSIIEAMAAGLPIVNMYINTGTNEGREGAYFFGVERAVKEEDFSGYTNLACRLIEDEQMREEWSQIALERYRKHYADPVVYARRHQQILEEICNDK